MSACPEWAEVKRVDRRDRGAHAVELHAGQQAPLDRQLDEPRLGKDIEDQPDVLQVVGGEPGPVAPVECLDLATPTFGPEQLAASEQGLRGGLQTVVVEPDEGAPQQRQTVENDTAAQDGARIPGEVLIAPDLELLVGPTERAASRAVAEAEERSDRSRTRSSR